MRHVQVCHPYLQCVTCGIMCDKLAAAGCIAKQASKQTASMTFGTTNDCKSYQNADI